MLILGKELNVTNEQVLEFAKSKWLKKTKTIEVEKETTTEEANKNDFYIKEYLEDMNKCVVIIKEEIENEEEPIEHIERIYRQPALDDIAIFLEAFIRKQLWTDEKIKKEEEKAKKELEKQIKNIIN